MRYKIFTIALALMVCVFSSIHCFSKDDKTAAKAATGTPLANAPEMTYTFKQVLEGTDVVHNFVIQNKGSAVLEIKEVKTT